jgi:SAM-dependent methyltransferase
MAEDDQERWDRRWAERSHEHTTPPDWLAELEDELPKGGRVLDVAAGTGRIALWFARAGCRVTAVDVSPVGLERLSEAARGEGLEVETIVADLETAPLPEGPWDAITCFAYLRRDLFPAMRDRLTPGGLLICGMTTLRNLQRHERPPARYCVEPNELIRLCTPLEVVYYREGWIDDQALARIVARKASPAP